MRLARGVGCVDQLERRPSGGAAGWSRLANVTESRNVRDLSSSSGSARISFPLCNSATWLATRSTSPIWWLESKHRPARAGQVDHAFEKVAPDEDVEPRGRLVEDQERGSDASASESETLARIPLESALIFFVAGSSKARVSSV